MKTKHHHLLLAGACALTIDCSIVLAFAAQQDAPVPTETHAHTTSTATRLHVVQPGDTVAAIAKRYGMGAQDFLRLNPDLKPDRLRVGQEIQVYDQDKFAAPENATRVIERPDGMRVHVVQPGDTVAAIAKRYGMGAQDFLRLNPDLKPNRLRVGQEIQIESREK